MTRRQYVERAASPRDYRELFKQTFGPVVAIYGSLAEEPERAAALDREFLEFAMRANSGPPEGSAEYRYEYLLVAARRARRVEEGRGSEQRAGRAHGRGKRRRR